jgi:hypothetical protein
MCSEICSKGIPADVFTDPFLEVGHGPILFGKCAFETEDPKMQYFYATWKPKPRIVYPVCICV